MQIDSSSTKYFAAYKNKKGINAIILDCMCLILLGSQLFKSQVLSGHFDEPFWDTFLLIGLLLWCYSFVKFFFEKTSFVVDHELLTVKRGILFRSERVYELDRMEEVEIETVKIKYFVDGIKKTNDKIVTFFYKEKEVALGFDLKGFNAEALAQATLSISTARC